MSGDRLLDAAESAAELIRNMFIAQGRDACNNDIYCELLDAINEAKSTLAEYDDDDADDADDNDHESDEVDDEDEGEVRP